MIAATLPAVPLMANAHDRYEVANLSALPGVVGSWPSGINSKDQVVGESFLYAGGRLETLAPPAGYASVAAYSINDRSQVAAAVYPTCYVLEPCIPILGVYRNGGWQELSDAGSPQGPITGVPIAINTKGQVIGYTQYCCSSPFTPADGPGFVYSGGKLEILPLVPNAIYSQPYAINASGEVVGAASIPVSAHTIFPSITHAFTYAKGKLTDLGTPSGYSGGSIAVGVNDRGDIAATATTAASDEQAFIYQDGKWHSLGAVDGFPYSEASDINASGDVVGTLFRPEGDSHPFLYCHGRMLDLNDLLSTRAAALYTLESASKINDTGEILAVGYATTDPTHQTMLALLLTPTGESAGD